MYLSCPSCHSTKVKKNGHTYYGKQNHRCKCCGRRFVMDNTHTLCSSKKERMEKVLKERLSLRAICLVFDVSMNWLQAFARSLWVQTPANLGLCTSLIRRIQKLQVFGIQIDELWSFVQKKPNFLHSRLKCHRQSKGRKASQKVSLFF
jgi:hypothetical protein